MGCAMTVREEIQPIILKAVRAILHVNEHEPRPIKESTGDAIASAVVRELHEAHELKTQFPESEVEQRIKEAILFGQNWSDGSGIMLTPDQCAFRIYSGLENPPTYLVRT